MKKLIILIILLFASTVYAADSCTYKMGGLVNGIREHRWVLDDNGGAADGTCSCSSALSNAIFGWIIAFKVVPNSSNPPDADYNLELRNQIDNFDYFYDECASLNGTSVTASANRDIPLTDAGGYPYLFGERVYPYASGMGSTRNQLTVYIYVKE